jgi:ABC-type sugar transport system permease subunit
MVLFLAAMEGIPESLYEAARIDGASDSTMFRRITIPLIWEVIATGVVFLIIGGLKVFDAIWVMENGRPAETTHTLATLMYAKVFNEYDIGYGTAIAVCLFVLTLTATTLGRRLMRRERWEYA